MTPRIGFIALWCFCWLVAQALRIFLEGWGCMLEGVSRFVIHYNGDNFVFFDKWKRGLDTFLLLWVHLFLLLRSTISEVSLGLKGRYSSGTLFLGLLWYSMGMLGRFWVILGIWVDFLQGKLKSLVQGFLCCIVLVFYRWLKILCATLILV